MNVLFLSELFYPHGSGGELATYLYAKLLSEAKINVVVVTNRFSGESDVLKSDNLTIYRLPLFGESEYFKWLILRKFDVLFSSFMRKLVRWADVVYIPRFWYSAIPLAKVYRKPVVIHLHGYIPICPLAVLYDASKNEICNGCVNFVCSLRCIITHERNDAKNFKEVLMSTALNSILGRYIGKLVSLSDALICVSQAQKRLIDKRVPSLSHRSYVIYNPLPEPFNVDADRNDFGYFGGPSILKGFSILVHALKNIDSGTVKVHATNFNNLPDRLVRSLSRLGIMMYRKLDRSHLRKLYRQISTVIVPSICPEPLPYVISEALLNKRLVIASRVGGIPEQVEGCPGAFLFNPGDYKQLAERIDVVKNLKNGTMAELGSRNKEILLKRFNNKRILRQFIILLEEVIS